MGDVQALAHRNPWSPTRTTAVVHILGGRWWLLPLVIYTLSRVVGAVVVLLLDHDQLVIEPGSVEGTAPQGSAYLTSMGNWDGQWYEQIARHGYPHDLPRKDGEVAQNAWAFYPVFPGLSRVVMEATRLSFPAAASLVALVAGAGAVCLLYRMLTETADRFTAGMGVLTLCLFPAAPVLQAAYTESLALLLVLGCLWAMRRQRYVGLAVLLVVLSLTRPVVLPVAAVVGLHWLARWWRRRTEPFPLTDRWGLAACAAIGVGGFALWPTITGLVTGEADAYLVTQRAWVIDGSGSYASWLGGLLSAGGRGSGVLAVVALLAVVGLVVRPSTRAWGSDLRSWALVYPVYVLASTRPTSSIVRYAMLAVVPWWPVPRPVDAPPLAQRTQVLVVVLVVLLGVAGQVIWVKACFVAAPGNIGYP